MEFKEHHNQVYHTPSSMYTYFPDQAVKEGLGNGTSMARRPVDMREEIQIELEKERIREQIVAKEIVRMRDLEAELRREMTMHNGGGFPSLSLNNQFRWSLSTGFQNYMGKGSSELNHRYSEYWNQKGSRVYGESQSGGFREGPWG